MSFIMPRYGNRRRLGGGSKWGRGSYASTMGLKPVPFRKRKAPTGAPVRLGRRVRPRMARSFTFTRTQKKKRGGRVLSHGDNQSSSYTVFGKRRMSRFDRLMYRKIVSPQTQFINGSGKLNSDQGRQFIHNAAFMRKGTLTAMETAAAGGATNVPVKLFLKSGKVTYRFRNQSNTNCKMSIYDIGWKRNSVSAALDDPGECWQKGLTDFGVSATFSQTVGQTPYRSPEFNQYCYTKKVTTVSLEPGQQHDHTVYHLYNRVVDTIEFQNNVGLSVAHLTRYLMVVFHGTLGHESATSTTVTYMPITIDYAFSEEYTYGWIEKTTRSMGGADALPTAVADFDFMGEAGDVDANLVGA